MAENKTVSQLFNQMYFIEQFVESVVSYTSKYNTSRSILYAPDTIIGKPGNYPNYGDFTDTYMLRSYGKWWKKSENYQRNYMPQDYDDVESEDYIIVKFEQPVIATRIAIYETYNPGAVVKLWGGSGNGTWKLLWKGEPQKSIQSANLFTPPIKIIKDVIYYLRIDFNQSHLPYHTAIDGVLLAGYKSKTPVQTKLFVSAFLSEDKKQNPIEKFDNLMLDNLKSPFSILPYEIIVYIFGYLDLKSLCACAQVNKTLNGASSDTLLYRQISFRRYWYQVTDQVLENFIPKCKFLCKLDLSWCCSELISETVFIRFLENCPMTLTHLSLGNCDFVRENSIEQIAKCSELTELRLRNITLINPTGFDPLEKLNNLITLDLFATSIDDESLIKILNSNRKLTHLNIEICENLKSLDAVMETLSANKNVRTMSCWKNLSLTSEGVKCLSRCYELREIDLGWSFFEPNDSLSHIAQNCPHLKRLIIAVCRSLTDTQLLPVIRNCVKLQQLDLLGIREVTVNVCEHALKSLPDLELLDISFCNGIQAKQVKIWNKMYPNVTIVRSCEQGNQRNNEDVIIPLNI